MADSLRLYRLIKHTYAAQPLAGRGGLSADGRWHTAGRPVAYLASSESLAILEVRVHLGTVLPADPYVLVTVECPAAIIATLPRRRWPGRWNAVPFDVATQRQGDRWLGSGRSAALRVPSVHSASEFNILLNPAHPQARRARVVNRTRYLFDPRMFP